MLLHRETSRPRNVHKNYSGAAKIISRLAPNIYPLTKNIIIHQEKFRIHGYKLIFGAFSMIF